MSIHLTTCSDGTDVLAELPTVTPLCIFAARRQSFKALVRDAKTSFAAKATLFDALPLFENGWDFTTAKITAAGMSERGTIWNLER